jgi:hypothetical protein
MKIIDSKSILYNWSNWWKDHKILDITLQNTFLWINFGKKPEKKQINDL